VRHRFEREAVGRIGELSQGAFDRLASETAQAGALGGIVTAFRRACERERNVPGETLRLWLPGKERRELRRDGPRALRVACVEQRVEVDAQRVCERPRRTGRALDLEAAADGFGPACGIASQSMTAPAATSAPASSLG
jgi:hypothetical protein